MAGSGVGSRGAADGSISCEAAGSGWRLWEGSEERAEHPPRVRARGEEETPAQSIRETGTGSKQTPPAAPRQPLPAAASSLAAPAAEGGAGGRAVPPPRAALPRLSPPRGAPPAAPGSAAARGRRLARGRNGERGDCGPGEVPGRAPGSRPQGLLGLAARRHLPKVRQDLGLRSVPGAGRGSGRPVGRDRLCPPPPPAVSCLAGKSCPGAVQTRSPGAAESEANASHRCRGRRVLPPR